MIRSGATIDEQRGYRAARVDQEEMRVMSRVE